MRECPKHPGANAGRFGDACVWCALERGERLNIGMQTPFMHKCDTDSLTEQLGTPIRDRDDFNRVRHQNPQIAVVESGSEQDKARKALRDWSRQDPARRGPPPAECLPKKTENPVNALDGHRILARIRKQKTHERPADTEE